MPLSARSRFALSALIMVSLLGWPRAIYPNSTNAIPLALTFIAVAFVVSVALRAGHARGLSPADKLAYAMEVPMIALTVSAALLCWNRPETRDNDRPDAASFGPFASVYDPCERGDDAIVCSGVARTVGYVCHGGYTMRIGRCTQGVCVPTRISDETHTDVTCKESP